MKPIDVHSTCCTATILKETDICFACKEHCSASALFILTPEQVTEIKDCNFEPKQVIVGVTDTPELRAQSVWRRIAGEGKFKLETLEPCPIEGTFAFTAELEE